MAANLADLSPTQKLFQSLKAGKPLGNIISLIKKGADVSARDKRGRTVLHHAAAGGNRETLAYLIPHAHLDLNSRDKYGETPLFHAVRFNRIAMLRYLITEGKLEPHATSSKGKTLLHYAGYYGSFEAFKILVLEYGVNIRAQDMYGCTPLHQTAEKGHVKILRYILSLEPRVDVNVKDNEGNTLLHYAVFSGKAQTIECCLALGADVNARNKKGHTIFSIAPTDSKLTEYLFKKMRTLAKAGNVEIQFKLGEWCFFNSPHDKEAYADISDPNREKTYGYILRAAEQGHAMANCYRGMLHEFGLFGIEVSFKQAGLFYEKAYQKIWEPDREERLSAGYFSLINLLRGVHCLMGTLEISEPQLGATLLLIKASAVKMLPPEKICANIEEEFQNRIYLFFKEMAEKGKFSALLVLAMMHAGGLFGAEKTPLFIDMCFVYLRDAIKEKKALPFNAATLCLNIAKMYDGLAIYDEKGVLVGNGGLWLPEDPRRAAAWRNLCAEKAEKSENSSNPLTINAIEADGSRALSSPVFPNKSSLLGGSSSSSAASNQSDPSHTATQERKVSLY